MHKQWWQSYCSIWGSLPVQCLLQDDVILHPSDSGSWRLILIDRITLNTDYYPSHSLIMILTKLTSAVVAACLLAWSQSSQLVDHKQDKTGITDVPNYNMYKTATYLHLLTLMVDFSANLKYTHNFTQGKYLTCCHAKVFRQCFVLDRIMLSNGSLQFM